MHKLTVVLPLMFSAALLTGCSNSTSHPTAPTTFASRTASFAVTPSTLTAQAVAGASCPDVAPFLVPFTLDVRSGDQSLSITKLAAQFTDTAGTATIPTITMPQVTLPAPIPTTQFGSALVEAQSERNIPLVFPIGCGTGHAGTVVIVIGTLDGLGRSGSAQLTATVH